jgi:ABC-2 type transport system permease protein
VGMDAYIIGKYLAMLSVTIVKTAILLLTGFLLTGKMLNMNPLSLGIFFITLILGSLFWTNIGLICGIKVKREDVRDIIYSIVLLPITFLSSVYYDLTTAPLWIRIIGNINPLTYITDLLRATYLDIPIRDYTFLILLITIGAISLIATINALWKVSIK